MGDSSLQRFSRDPLERGDGLSFDGEEVVRPGVNQNNYFSEAELSNDYLERGGGFSQDESDAGMDQALPIFHLQLLMGKLVFFWKMLSTTWSF